MQPAFQQVDLPIFDYAAFHEADRKHIARALREQRERQIEMDSAAEDEPEAHDGCPDCSGTGEGQHDGTSCRSCRGRGY